MSILWLTGANKGLEEFKGQVLMWRQRGPFLRTLVWRQHRPFYVMPRHDAAIVTIDATPTVDFYYERSWPGNFERVLADTQDAMTDCQVPRLGKRVHLPDHQQTGIVTRAAGAGNIVVRVDNGDIVTYVTVEEESVRVACPENYVVGPVACGSCRRVGSMTDLKLTMKKRAGRNRWLCCFCTRSRQR